MLPLSCVFSSISYQTYVANGDKLLHLSFKVQFSPWDFSRIPSEFHVIVTYRWVNARWRVAAGCDISRSLLERHSLAVPPPPSINILQMFRGRVHIYFVSCMVLPKPLSSGWSGIKGSAVGTHWGTHTHTWTNTAKSHYQRRHRDGVWIKLPDVGRSAKCAHRHQHTLTRTDTHTHKH